MPRARIVITDDGKLQVFVIDGGFAPGKKAIEDLISGLQADGASFSEIKPAEQHRHDAEPLKNTEVNNV